MVVFGFELAYFLAQFQLHCWCILLDVRFPQVFLVKTGRARISLMFTLLDNSFRLPFSFPNFSFVPGASSELQVCPAEAFNPNSSTLCGLEFIGSEF